MNEQTNDKKLVFKQIGFEITRKCNMTCRHCMRGEAQDRTIFPEVIDKFLDNVAAAGSVILTGGEPFLEPQVISYLFDEIIRREIPVMNFSCVTNGSIRDKSIADAWNRLANYIADRHKPTGDQEEDRKYLRAIGQITVSNDPYHQLDEDPLETVKWYRQYLNDHCIIKKEVINPREPEERIYILGRAAQQEDLKTNPGAFYHVCPYRLEVSEDGSIIETCIMVGWDGKLMIGEDSSYEQQDKVNYGNIFDGYVCDLLLQGWFYEPFTKEEALAYDALYTMLKTGNYVAYDRETADFLLTYYNTVYTAREVARKAFPWMTYKEIVEAVYDDMNLQMRKSDKDVYVRMLGTHDPYEVALAESYNRVQSTKLKALLYDGKNYLQQSQKFGRDIKSVPIKSWD